MLNTQKVINVFFVTTILYFVFIISLFFLNGNLKYEYKSGVLSSNKSLIDKMLQGINYQQKFSSNIDIIEGITIQIGTYGQKVSDTLTFKILSNDLALATLDLPTENIQDMQVLNIALPEPLKVDKSADLILSISSNNGTIDNGVSLFSSNIGGKSPLYINGTLTDKQLDFDVYGKNLLFLGKYYVEVAIICYVIIALLFLIIITSIKYKKNDFLILRINNLIKYSYLLRQLISRDFKVKYKRSILGIFWSFLNPVLMMTIQYIVFSNLFKFDIPNYALYLLIGIVMFGFFVEATTNGMASIVTNASLLTKVYIPKYIFPTSKVLSSSINLLLSFIPLFIAKWVSGIGVSISFIFLPYFVIMLMFFTIGMSLMLASFMVFFRDTQFLWGVFSSIWMYATPIIYPISILPDFMQKVMVYNPMYQYINAIRMIMMEGAIPNINVFAYSFIYAFIMLLIGALIFKKEQNRFVLYI